ncbi:MAG: phytoene/squalene synthase family protein [Pseudorhodoplanes sp.]
MRGTMQTMANDAFSSCGQLVREADRDRFLALLFAPAAARPQLFALHALDLELARVAQAVSGPMPGEIRLQWWRDVLAGARAEEAAAHPVARAFLQLRARCALPAPLCARLVDAHAFDLYDEPPAHLADLEAAAEDRFGTLIRLAALVLTGGRDPAPDRLAAEAGTAQGLVAVLRGFSPEAARGRIRLPADILSQRGVNPDDILSGRDRPEIREALADLRGAARGHLDAAAVRRQEAPAAIRSMLSPALLPLSLARAFLDRLDSAPPFAPVEIPAWRRQWILWRAARG